MVKKTTIWTDSDTVEKLRAMARDGNVSALLRDIANGNHNPGKLTIDDIATQIGTVHKSILAQINQLAIHISSHRKLED